MANPSSSPELIGGSMMWLVGLNLLNKRWNPKTENG